MGLLTPDTGEVNDSGGSLDTKRATLSVNPGQLRGLGELIEWGEVVAGETANPLCLGIHLGPGAGNQWLTRAIDGHVRVDREGLLSSVAAVRTAQLHVCGLSDWDCPSGHWYLLLALSDWVGVHAD